MSSLKHCVDLLKENERNVYKDARRILSTLCNNVIEYPREEKYRKVRLSNSTVVEKILPAAGAMECLFAVGFVENDDHLLLPHDAPLSRLEELRWLLSEKQSQRKETTPVALTRALPTVLPPPKSQEESFFDQIRGNFQNVLRYEDKSLQEKARLAVPLARLQIGALERMRSIQRAIKAKGNERSAEDITMEDLLLIELLRWFKQEFFRWIDSPACTACSNPCTFERVVGSSDRRISRIEIHRCGTCRTEVEFPRYTDPAVLLTTRQGRCGEWTNAFTLICRSLGYDARLVHDKTDHVWTEVWSIAGGRWIHADPCENTMDRPLMYERGWGKKLSYVIGYSRDEIQDVTWRYTQDQSSVMKRRQLCSEESLLTLLRTLNEERQGSAHYSTSRKIYVTRRSLLELVEMLPVPPGVDKSLKNDEDYQERTSGSFAWRLARGEIKSQLHRSHVWLVPKGIHTFQLCYTASKNVYRMIGEDGIVLEQRLGWEEGVDKCEGGIFRKVEDDWKMVYLARSPGSQAGQITWTIHASDPNVRIDLFDFQAVTAVFHNATVQWKAEGFYEDGLKKIVNITDTTDFSTNQLKGASKFSLTATLTGGKDDLAWQHAQLFRQSIDATEHSIVIRIKLSKCS